MSSSQRDLQQSIPVVVRRMKTHISSLKKSRSAKPALLSSRLQTHHYTHTFLSSPQTNLFVRLMGGNRHRRKRGPLERRTRANVSFESWQNTALVMERGRLGKKQKEVHIAREGAKEEEKMEKEGEIMRVGTTAGLSGRFRGGTAIKSKTKTGGTEEKEEARRSCRRRSG